MFNVSAVTAVSAVIPPSARTFHLGEDSLRGAGAPFARHPHVEHRSLALWHAKRETGDRGREWVEDTRRRRRVRRFQKGLNVVSDPGRVRVCCEEGSRDSRLVRYSVDSSPELVHRRHETPVVAERPDEKARALRTDKGDCWCCKHRVSENLQKKNVPDTMFAPNVSEGL